jgi:hypothetical protein
MDDEKLENVGASQAKAMTWRLHSLQQLVVASIRIEWYGKKQMKSFVKYFENWVIYCEMNNAFCGWLDGNPCKRLSAKTGNMSNKGRYRLGVGVAAALGAT